MPAFAQRKSSESNRPVAEDPSPTSTEPSAPRSGNGNGHHAQQSMLQLVMRWLRSNFGNKHHDATLKEVFEEVLEEHEDEGVRLAPEEKTMIRNMLSFGDITVSDIMVPRPDIVAVEQAVTLDELKKHIIEQRHTRIPVYRETQDDMLGFLHIKDLVPMFSSDSVFDIQNVMRKLLFVPPSMKIIDLLVKMRLSGEHMAIVVDEYGGTDGLVTMEDLFEEIVGDIQDEHDDAVVHQDIVWVSETLAEADARLPIEKLEEELGFTVVPEDDGEDFDTLGGLIFFFLGRVPAKGEIIDHPSGMRLEILEADPRRIKRVRIIKHVSTPVSEPA